MKQNNSSKNKSYILWSIDIDIMFSVGMWSRILCKLLFTKSAKKKRNGIGQAIVEDHHNYNYSHVLFRHPNYWNMLPLHLSYI